MRARGKLAQHLMFSLTSFFTTPMMLELAMLRLFHTPVLRGKLGDIWVDLWCALGDRQHYRRIGLECRSLLSCCWRNGWQIDRRRWLCIKIGRNVSNFKKSCSI